MATVLTIFLVWVLLSIPVSLLAGWALSRTTQDVPFSKNQSLPQGVVRVEFSASKEAEQFRKFGS